jgi:thiol-disulfide isomerase/thioredoxin
MDLKTILIGAGILAVAVTLIVLFRRRRAGSGAGSQGFQNPAGTMSTFTMYYADWCPHCQSVKPEFEELIKKGDVEVGGKKCKIQMVSPEKEPEAAKGKDIKGFPTFLLESAEGQVFEYKGERNTAGYLAFINEKLGGGI